MKKVLEWYYGRASIRKKLVISYLILVLVPIMILGIYSYHISKKHLLMQTRDAVNSNVASIAYSLESNIQRENDNLKYLSYNSLFRKSLEEGEENRMALALQLNRSVEPVFWYFLTSDRNMKGIEIYTPYLEQELGNFLKPEKDGVDQAWYQYHQTNFKTLWTSEGRKLYATRPVLDAATSSRTIGVMKLEVYHERFMEPLYKPEYLENGVLLLDADGQILASKAVRDVEVEQEVQRAIAEVKDAGMQETDRYILRAGEPFENGWRMFYYVDKKEIAGDMNAILGSTLLMMTLCLLIITVLISYMSRVLSRRILNLKHCVEQVGEGNFKIETESGYTDEIGVVANSLNVMSRKIDEMMNQMYQLGLEKRATELQALQAMLNPHFLYNCLSSVKWKAIRSEQDDIADITGLLAKFYRTTLNEGKQITRVSGELENVRAYLEIQSRMHEGNFDIEYAIADEGMNCEMPNFLLQPIVENAICHGIENCSEEERGKIRIEYRMEKDYLIFCIYNNGPAPDVEELQKILCGPGKGYGIYSIQERIRMYYDDTCGIFPDVTDDGLTCFTVRIRSTMKST